MPTTSTKKVTFKKSSPTSSSSSGTAVKKSKPKSVGLTTKQLRRLRSLPGEVLNDVLVDVDRNPSHATLSKSQALELIVKHPKARKIYKLAKDVEDLDNESAGDEDAADDEDDSEFVRKYIDDSQQDSDETQQALAELKKMITRK